MPRSENLTPQQNILEVQIDNSERFILYIFALLVFWQYE